MSGKTIDWRYALESRFGGALHRFFVRRTRDGEAARDLTQEVFARILSQDRERHVDNPDAYVFTVASNLLREQGRHSHVRGTSYAGAVDSDICDFLRSGAEDFTPERIVTGREALDGLIGALNMLSSRTRSIFILHRVEGMSQKNIAQQLDISVSAVEKHIAKALAHLARQMAE